MAKKKVLAEKEVAKVLAKVKKELPKHGIKDHPKFDKFKGAK